MASPRRLTQAAFFLLFLYLVTAVTEPVYRLLRNYFLAVEQPHYWRTALLGTVFGTIVALNFSRARFWWRYICPLGALLGLIGKNPLLRLKTDPDRCNDCHLCVADCQGGANPLLAISCWLLAEMQEHTSKHNKKKLKAKS